MGIVAGKVIFKRPFSYLPVATTPYEHIAFTLTIEGFPFSTNDKITYNAKYKAQRCLHVGRHDGWRYRLFVILTTYKFLTLGKKQANLYLLSLYRHFPFYRRSLLSFFNSQLNTGLPRREYLLAMTLTLC